jgi:hypothetical protein
MVSEGEQETQGQAGDELARVRDVILRAHPDVVPEMVQGSSVAELLGSVEAARAAYQGVIERAKGAQAGSEGTGQQQGQQQQEPPRVPAGGGAATVSVDDLPTAEKIKRGIAAARR